MKTTSTELPTDIWAIASWDEYIELIDDRAYENARGYYYKGRMLIETLATGYDRSCDRGIILFAVNLFGTIKGIPLNGLIACSFRQVGVLECQPDVSYYIGELAQIVPRGTKVVDLNLYLPPSLAIEVADTTLSHDLGNKRLLYEEVSVEEYWVVDVESAQLRAFAVAGGGSRSITESRVLPGLSIELLAEALRRSREQDQAQVGTWLWQQFQAL